MAMKLGDYTITEAGFGADLGAEKFFDIKCRYGGLKPDCVVIVATIRALKHHGGVAKDKLNEENVEALSRGVVNLEKQIENIQKFKVPVVVAINKFISDTDAEVEFIKDFCKSKGVEVSLTEVWGKGAEGGVDLAEKVISTMDTKPSKFEVLYEAEKGIAEKIETIAKEIYGADGVDFTDSARKQILEIEKLGLHQVPICVAKTQNSLSDNPKLLGRPTGFRVSVKEVKLSNGAGFIVVLTGTIMTMPGLPKVPAANKMDILEDGKIIGLF